MILMVALLSTVNERSGLFEVYYNENDEIAYETSVMKGRRASKLFGSTNRIKKGFMTSLARSLGLKPNFLPN